MSEKTMTDAPAWYNPLEASAWASGYNAAADLLNGLAQEAPGHTDLMVTPESIDAFLEKNPPIPFGFTEAEGYAASLRQQAKWIRECKLDGTIDADELDAAAAFIDRSTSRSGQMSDPEPLAQILMRCRTVLGNMAMENTSGLDGIFNRWPISHEPLRSDAKGLVPLIDEALANHHKAAMASIRSPGASIIDWEGAYKDALTKIHQLAEQVELRDAQVEGLKASLPRLVDWTHLYATEGQSWIHQPERDKLIELAERNPLQEDAEHFQASGLLKHIPSSLPSTQSPQEGSL